MSKTKRTNRRRLWLLTAGFVLLVACAVVWQVFPPATWNEPAEIRDDNVLTVRFLDVGQGDCALLTVNDTAVLVDAGTVERPNLAAELLAAYGVTKLDAVIVSHPHADHIGGLPTVLERIPVKTLVMQAPRAAETLGHYYDKTLALLSEKGVKRVEPTAGDTFSVGEIAFTVLGPLADEAEDLNDLSLCVRADYGERNFLFCGDMTAAEEQTLLQVDDGLSADVLKVAHHGSGGSNSREFLEAVHPEIAVVSCGLYNDYGHPHASALTRLAAVGADVYRTDKRGTVTVTTDGKTVAVSCEKTEETKTTRYREDTSSFSFWKVIRRMPR